jgi:CubicO group peptidase (beta-lactamase class C family)
MASDKESPVMRFATALGISAALLLSMEMPVSVNAQSPLSDDAALDGLIAKHMADANIMGVGAAVIVNRRVVWTKGYGFADYRRTRPFTPNTVMYVASITKSFTGVTMMRAVREGRLSLDADINGYLPFRVVNPHVPDAPITLRHLATHTSGIKDRWEVFRAGYHYGGEPPVPLGDFLTSYFTSDGARYSRDNFLNARPGARREYSNIGAALAGFIVERAFGESLPDYARRHIFAPLKMANTAWRLADVAPGTQSTLFVSQNGLEIPIPPYDLTDYPSSGIRTSVSDLSKFFIALLNGGEYQGARILDLEMTAEMTRFQFSDANRPENFPAEEGNSGLFWRTKFNGTRVGHGGNDPGVSAEMQADLAGQTGIVVFSNTSVSGPAQRSFIEIWNALWAYAESRRNP